MLELSKNATAILAIGIVLGIAVSATVVYLVRRGGEKIIPVQYIGGEEYDNNFFTNMVIGTSQELTPEIQQATLNWIRKYKNDIINLMPEFENDLCNRFHADNENIKLVVKAFGAGFDNLTIMPEGWWWSTYGDMLVSCRWDEGVVLGENLGARCFVTLAFYVFIEPKSLELNRIFLTKLVMPILE